jgi:DNA-directed RNA polymerase beta subunit
MYILGQSVHDTKWYFVINGAERVVVSQLHRSPGVSLDLFMLMEQNYILPE